MLIGFNFNGTLVGPGSATPLPSVIQRLDELPASARLFITMNEVGPVLRAMAETGKSTMPTVEDIADNIRMALAAFNRQVETIYIATGMKVRVGMNADEVADWQDTAEWAASRLLYALSDLGNTTVFAAAHPEWRKPRGGMLRQARRDLGRLPSLYIGGRGFDQRAAADANVRFLHVDTWRHQGLAGVPNVSTW